MIFRKTKTLGLDMGTRKIKGVVLEQKGQDIILDSLTLHDHRMDPHAKSNSNKDVDLLKSLIDAKNLKGSKVAAAIEDREFELMITDLPPLSEEEISLAIQSKIESKAGSEIANFSFDYLKILNRKAEAEETYLVYYTKMNLIREIAELLENSSLVPLAIESNLHAAIESLKFNGYVNEHDTNILVDIGENHTSIGLVSKGDLIHVNNIRAGGADINESLRVKHQLNYREAEELKINFQFEKTENTEISALNQTIEDGYSKIIVGIHDSITYLKAAFKDQMIMNVFLIGGGANKKGIQEILEEGLNIPVHVPNALKNIQIFAHSKHNPETLAKVAIELHPAIGLALRGIAA
jgi:type IV pilus assembly protein PilM